MRVWCLVAVALCVGGVGCSRPKQPKEVGGDLPVTSSSSVALPGATDAADAPRAPSVAESRSASLTLYRDPAAGVSFEYPSVWRPAVAGQGIVAPAFAAYAGAAKITQEFSPVGNLYAATVLRGLSFSYTVTNRLSAAACAALPGKVAQAGAAKQANYNGVTYTEAAGEDAGACTQVARSIDTASRGRQCFVFERDFITSCPYVKTATAPRPLTPTEKAALQRHLDEVMQSVQIASR